MSRVPRARLRASGHVWHKGPGLRLNDARGTARNLKPISGSAGNAAANTVSGSKSFQALGRSVQCAAPRSAHRVFGSKKSNPRVGGSRFRPRPPDLKPAVLGRLCRFWGCPAPSGVPAGLACATQRWRHLTNAPSAVVLLHSPFSKNIGTSVASTRASPASVRMYSTCRGWIGGLRGGRGMRRGLLVMQHELIYTVSAAWISG